MHLIHEQNIVLGDLRDPNILYIASKTCAVVVDFDWPGVDGVDIYPATLNPTNEWQEDVSPYGIMRKAHDVWQLERLEDLCQRGAELVNPPSDLTLYYTEPSTCSKYIKDRYYGAQLQ